MIELVFVMVILVVLLGTFMPRFNQSFSHLQTERAVFETAQLLRYAQSAAVTSRQVVECLYVSDPPTFALRGGQLPARFGNGKPLPKGVSAKLLHDREAVEAFHFYPDGTSEGGEILIGTLQVESEYRITIDAITGQISVLRPAAS